MNKTININLGGFFFHIDEIAYQKLRRYLESVSKSLNDDPQGKSEIIADIEARISELLSERITDARQVVNENDIEEIIKIMGKPEDYAEAEETYDNTYTYQKRTTNSRKLFRDGDDKFLGGVAAGIAHYFTVDVIWIRLILLALFFGAGFGIIIYIILWILLPEAQTTTEKLQMEGEPVNIDNIERKIREEFQHVSDRVREGAGEVSEKIKKGANEISDTINKKYSKRSKNGFQDFLDALGKIILAVFKVVGKFIGVLLLFIASAVLIALLIGGFSMGSFEVLNISDDFMTYPPIFYGSLIPIWLLSVFLLILIAVPFLILFVLGLRILSSSVSRFSKTTSLSLFGIWLIALLGISFSGIEYVTSNAHSGSSIKKTTLNISEIDTLHLKVINDDNLNYNHSLRRDYTTVEVEVQGVKKSYSNDVRINIEKSDDDNAYIQIRKRSNGKSRILAKKNAFNIDYQYELVDNTLIFNAYFLSDYKNLWKDEDVEIIIYIPENTTVFFEKSSKYFLKGIDNTDNIYDRDMAKHHFTMTKKGFECTDCEEEEEEIIEEQI